MQFMIQSRFILNILITWGIFLQSYLFYIILLLQATITIPMILLDKPITNLTARCSVTLFLNSLQTSSVNQVKCVKFSIPLGKTDSGSTHNILPYYQCHNDQNTVDFTRTNSQTQVLISTQLKQLFQTDTRCQHSVVVFSPNEVSCPQVESQTTTCPVQSDQQRTPKFQCCYTFDLLFLSSPRS